MVKILLIDDHAEVSQLMAMILQRHGYDVNAANNGQAGLSRAMTELPDLIILDAMLYGISGYEICRQLRADSRTKDTPIIFFSAASSIEAKTHGFEAGADEYLIKPTHPTEFVERVEAVLARSNS